MTSMEGKSRVLGGFAIIPTPLTLRRINRPKLRAAAIVMALRLLSELRTALNRLRADTAIELHYRHGLSWDKIAVHFGVTKHYIHTAAQARRAQLDQPPVSAPVVTVPAAGGQTAELSRAA
jgi:hypothetical protein